MFRQVLSTTPLFNNIANDYFTNIRGGGFQGDYTFVTTMRALVASRMADDEKIRIHFAQSSYAEQTINAHSVTQLLRARNSSPEDFESGDVCIHSLTNTSQDNAVMLKKLKQDFTKENPGWKIIDKVEGFFRKTFSAICFINPEQKNSIIFVDNMDIRKYHYLQCGIFAFMPWYFDPEKGVNEQEMELIKSLWEKTSEKYEKCIAEYAKQFNFRELRLQKLLSGFETKFESMKVKRIEDEITRTIRKINEYNAMIGDYLKSKQESEIQLLGLKAKIAEGGEDSEIMDYFLCNKNVVLESVTDTTMRFCTTGYISYYDEDAAESVIDNPTSYVYRPNGRPCNNIIPAEDMKMLMTAIFLDKKLRMKFCACYTFELRGNVRAESCHIYDSVEFRDCTPNTHIDRYSCMGNYQQVINELLQEHNYIGAIEQCMASTVSLNFSDSCVMEEFMRRMYEISDYSVNIRCIELPDGRAVKPKEAIEYLKSQNQQGDEVNG